LDDTSQASLLAVGSPAWRASRVDPTTVLRAEQDDRAGISESDASSRPVTGLIPPSARRYGNAELTLPQRL